MIVNGEQPPTPAAPEGAPVAAGDVPMSLE